MAATIGKGVKIPLNREAMNKEELPESLHEYADILEGSNEIDVTEMFMAMGKAMKPIEESLQSLERYIRRPWWKKLFGMD